MKFIKKTIVLIFAGITVYAQNTPVPPQTPSSSSSHTQVVSSSSKVSSSTSISNSNNDYKFKSKFDISKKEAIENILKEELEGIVLKRKRNELLWEVVENEEVIFECSLTKNRLSIYLDKYASDNSFNRKVERLGEQLQEYISSHKKHTFYRRENLVNRAEARLERAKRELQASIKNLEEVKRKEGN